MLRYQALELSCVGIFSEKKILVVPSRVVISFKCAPVVFQREAESHGNLATVVHPRNMGLVCSFENNVVSTENNIN